MTSLSPDDTIETADVLYLVGDESDILLARQRLSEGA
jgi:K+/H+ antiporter YhaU regulatory subunit KhtT